MNRMVYELRRRRNMTIHRPASMGTRHRQRGTRRWCQWARQLLTRYRRGTALTTRVGLVLPGYRSSGDRASRGNPGSWHLQLAVQARPTPTSIAASPAVVRAAPAARTARLPDRGRGPGADAPRALAPARRMPQPAQAGRPRVTALAAMPSTVNALRVISPAHSQILTRHWHDAPPSPPTAARLVPTADRTAVVVPASRHAAHRVLERGRRVDSSSAATQRLLGAPARPMTATRVVRQPPRQPVREPQPWPPSERPHRTNELSDRPERIDVDQLADQVVRRIDERIIAHRERLGRV